ncbi:hypothetical protein ONS95_007640 [Cadophora gregata]|uniref:uncharacterized protein n=1 Tax=Cadophora gregata TaxID=51156 RepID=UPI0026DC9755|nr:uncharacterized protein ONS95_007640 [Cadophora gregata]KAK0126019.1 hypothetical protein ONS95_007640 [Cadophora gregata]
MSSRHSGSSRHRSHQSRSNDTNAEEMIEQVKTIVTQLNDVVASNPHDWETYLPSARSALAALEHVRFFRNPQRYAEQVWILHGLQDYAFHDSDSGCIPEIADFCQTSWLRILRNYPENVETLTGLGSNWLQRAQATLARIQREECNDSSSQGSGQAASPPTDPRRQGPLYVEARGYLQPAVDFYARAVRSSDALGRISGDILASAAESQMSLGNVTASPGDERCFTQAIRYLRRADAIPGYTLSIYLEQYLNDYGRYVS